MIVTKDDHRDRKHLSELIRKCPKCRNEAGVIVLAGVGSTFFFCPICSPLKESQDKKPELAMEE